MIVATHNGSFHADDVTAYAIIKALHPDADLVRTRDPEVLDKADIVFDVGMVFDRDKDRYDHHMKDAPVRLDGSPYSSVGLVWDEFGPHYLTNVFGIDDEELNFKVWNDIDKSLIKPIDLIDNGKGEKNSMDIPEIVDAFNPPWDSDENQDNAFEEASKLVGRILDKKVRQALSNQNALTIVEEALMTRENPNILVLPRSMPWQAAVFANDDEELLYVVYPQNDMWYLAAVPPEKGSFDQRKPLPNAWGGLTGDDLSKVTGVEGTVFCHNSLFCCGAKSFTGIMDMAKIAIEHTPNSEDIPRL